jgi:hypothetical protein
VLSEPEGECSDTYGEPQLTNSMLKTGVNTADEHVTCLLIGGVKQTFFFLCSETRLNETNLKTYV